MSRKIEALLGTCAVICVVVSAATALAAPVVSGAFASRFALTNASPVGDVFGATQMAMGPGGRLYVAKVGGGISSYAYAGGILSDRIDFGGNAFGMAFATHAVPGEGPRTYMYSARSENFEGIITRLSDDDGDHIWGESGEVNVDIVRGVPTGDHTFDQLQIHNNQLFLGIGARTNNGLTGNFTGQNFHDEPAGPVGGGFGGGGDGFTFGETSYTGAIGTIRDLSQVAHITSAAQLRDGPNGTSGNLLAGRDAFLPGAPHAALPYSSSADDKLIVHSAGTRNPFGLAIDSDGDLYFTNNYGRADTNGNGTSNPHHLDDLDADLSNDVADQFFRAVAGGDYRYANANFRGTPAFPTTEVRSITFDNLDSDHPLFGTLHDSAHPEGLGPHSSSNGFDFATLDLTGALATDDREYALISRWTDTVAELAPGTDSITYRDVVVVDPATGQTRRLAEGFGNPIDVLNDGAGGYLIADFGFGGTIWRITSIATTSRWNIAAGGNWGSAANWAGPVPDGIGAVASFTGAVSTDATISLAAPRIAGTVNFDSPHRYSIEGSATLTIDVAAGFGAINAINGDHLMNTPVHLLKDTRIDVAESAALAIAGDQSASAGVSLRKTGGGELTMKSVRVGPLAIDGGTLRLEPAASGAVAAQVRSLAIAGGIAPLATLDLTSNAAIIDYTGLSPIEAVAAQIAHAHDGGSWAGEGIGSSSAAVLGGIASVGYAETADLGIGSFGGVVFDGDALLVRFTRTGDANLDGIVELADFSRLAANFNQPARWSTGDFNYDGMNELGDFALLAANFGFLAPAGRHIPEPVSPWIAALALLRRRRGTVLTCCNASLATPSKWRRRLSGSDCRC